MEDHLPIIVSFGGGTNSTAMLCGFRERGIVPSMICFADTGGELPHTYDHVSEMDWKCFQWWGIGIVRVRKLYQGRFEGLEGQALRHKQLPSLAYGHRSCSVKYKGEPQRKELRKWMLNAQFTEVRKAIGFDAGEAHRVKGKSVPVAKGLIEHSWYPLVEWNWRRADCYAAIQRHGIKQPGKSSCFFCPAMKRHEILKLREEYPEYYARALAMEENLKVEGRVRGLYMGVPWSEIVAADDAQTKLALEWVEEHDEQRMPCGCYDG